MNIWKKIARVAQAVAFFALLFISIAVVSRVMMRKESLTRNSELLSHPDVYDVLFVGNSHVINAVHPMELWDDYGISSYVFANGGNTMAVTYWMLQNAFACGVQPKLIVIEMDDVGRQSLLQGNASEIHTALDAFPLTRTKIDAIEGLMSNPEDYVEDGRQRGMRFTKIKWEYYFPLAQYHERWSQLTEEDFHWKPDIQRGAWTGMKVGIPPEYEIIEEYDRSDGTGYGYDYLHMMISDCKKRGIDVLLMYAPFAAGDWQQREANAVWPIAEQYGIDFLDFVAMDSVADYQTDSQDGAAHLNASGGRKVTDFLGRYIIEHFDIADRRGDAQIRERWDADYDAFLEYKLSVIDAQEGADSALMLLHDADWSAVIAIPRDSALYEDENLLRLVHNAAREHVYEDTAYSMWSNDLYPLDQLDTASAHSAPYLVVIDRTDGGYMDPVLTQRLGVGTDTIQTGFGALSYVSGEDGQTVELDGAVVLGSEKAEQADLCIAVIDNRTGEVALVKAFHIQ